MKTSDKTDRNKDKVFYFMGTSMVYFQRDADDAVEETLINTLMESKSPQVLRENLDRLNQGAAQQAAVEQGLTVDQIKKIVITNINLLANCTPEEFRGEPADGLPN